MTGQVAIACVLLVGATLLSRSLLALMHAERGYDPVNVLTATLPLPRSYAAESRIALVDALVPRLAELPRVTHAAIGNALPFLSWADSRPSRSPRRVTPGQSSTSRRRTAS
jgi:hypothetical protein